MESNFSREKLVRLISKFLQRAIIKALLEFELMSQPANRERDFNILQQGRICSICQEHLRREEVVIETYCDKSPLVLIDGKQSNTELSHIFHKNCILRWFHSGHIRCPLCRLDLYEKLMELQMKDEDLQVVCVKDIVFDINEEQKKQ